MNQYRNVLKQNGFKYSDLFGRQVDSFVSSSINRIDTLKPFYRGMPSTTIAASFPMVDSILQDPAGFCLGTSTASGYTHQVLIPRQKLVEHQNMPCWILTLNCSEMMCVMTCKLSQKPKFAKHCSLLIIYVKFHYENPFCHI